MRATKATGIRRRTVMLTLVLLAGAALLGGVGYIDYLSAVRDAASRARANIASVGELKAEQVDRWLGERRLQASRIQDSPLLAASIGALVATPDRRPGSALLAQLRTELKPSGFDSVEVIDTRSRLRAQVGDVAGDALEHTRSLRRRAALTTSVEFLDLHRHTDGSIRLGYVVPMHAAGGGVGRLLGFVVLTADPYSYLYPLIDRWPVETRSGETLIVRREDDRVLFLNPLRFRKDAALRISRPVDDPYLPAARALRGAAGVMDGADYREVPVLAMARPLAGAPWVVVAKEDRRETYEPVDEAARTTMLLGVALALVTGAGVTVLWRGQAAEMLRHDLSAEKERSALAERLALLSRYANDMVLLFDAERRVVDANDRALQVYGYSRDEMLQLTMADLRAPEALGTLDRDLARVHETGGNVYETLHRKKDGSTFPSELSVRLVMTQGGRYYQAVARDVTARRVAEDALRRSEERYREVVEGTDDLITVTDGEGLLVYANRKAAAAFGLPAEEVLGRSTLDFVHPDDRDRTRRWFERLAAGRTPSGTIENRQVSVTGEIRDVLWASNFHYDEAGRLLTVSGIARDVTEQRRVESALAQEAAVVAGMAELSQRLLAASSVDEVTDLTLDEALRLTHSPDGFVGYVDPVTGSFVAPALTGARREECRVTDKSTVFDRLRGLLGWILDNRVPMLTNDPSRDARSGGVPTGHIPIERLLGVPAIRETELVGLIAVANSPDDYEQDDLVALQRLANLYALGVERRRAQDALAASEDRFRRLAENAQDIIYRYRLRPDPGFEYVSPAATVVIGYTPEEHYADSSLGMKMIHPGDREALAQMMRDPKNGASVMRWVRKDGRVIWLEQQNVVIPDDKGEVIAIEGIARDVTEAHELEQRKSDFAAMVSHELRSPLAVILAAAALLDRPEIADSPETVRANAERIQRRGAEMLHMVEDLLHAWRQQAGGEPELAPVQVDVGARLREWALDVQFSAIHSLTFAIQPDLPVVVCDPDRVRHAVINLLGNAVKFSPRGGRVELGAERDGDAVRIWVSDEGVGIDPADLERVFDRFAQADMSATRSFGGFGLGLFIVRTIAEAHGGSVSATSRPGGGSTFTMSLPLRPPPTEESTE